ncbi:MAG: non-ribosomal peptide synthetase, partial [Candidatus Binatia bacterium]
MPEPTILDRPSRLEGAETLPVETVAATGASEPPRVTGAAGASSSKYDLYQQSNLTRNQLQVWMGQALVPELPVYNLATALTIAGEVEVDRFRNAFQALINSSDALRTVLAEFDGIPTQKIVPDLPYTMEFLDFSSPTDPRATARIWMQERCSVPLDWKARLFDSVLIKLSEKEFVWYLNVHHLICDGWSFELIYRHTSDFYLRSLQARPSQSIALPRFADYLAYERAYRESPRHRKIESYWQGRLSEKRDALSFYGKFPGAVTTRVRRISYDLGPERTNGVRLAAGAGGPAGRQISLLQIFTAILVAYLHRLNGKPGYTVGIPFHNRRTKIFKQTIGFFSELLPIHLEVAEDETFASLINKVKSEVLKAVRHGQYAVANPYFRRVYETVINYQTRSLAEFGGMPAFPEWVHNGHGDESLAVQIHDFGVSGSLKLDFDLHESIFDEQESKQVVEHFVRVIDSFLSDPGQSLRDLTLLAPEEARQVLIEWNHAEAGPAETRLAHEIFREQVRQQPQAAAVILEDQRLTYAELNRRANQLARYLGKRGVAPETRVIVYVERSFEMVIALLGILKAGAAYVPIDSKYPVDWLRYVLEKTAAPLLLTQRRLAESLPGEAPEMICLDSEWDAIGTESDEEIESNVTADHVAYVIYTSGTAGDPKGVEIPHRALANFAARAAQLFALDRTDRVLQFASIGFDTSVEEIFPCLMTGAALVLRTDSMLESASAFLHKCRHWGITVLDLPTSYWHDLTARLFSDDLSVPDSIRLVVIGGERAIPERLALWQACVSDRVTLLNTYGPTETTVTATACDLSESCADPDRFSELPIGRPLPHVQTYVLDRNLRPVPIGVPGELFIGGLGVARGYLDQPDLTAEKFLHNPFVDNPGARIYRTGDLVRYRTDGHLEFLGRMDRQVKIRGFRVELEGIENVLRKHPLVQDAAVVQDPSSTKKPLIAHLLPKAAAVLNLDELKEFARTKLPEYMLPGVFLIRQSLPLTPQGKVDRRALAAPDHTGPEVAKRFVPPQTPTEARIAAIWREVLDVKEIGRNDHFFELGGHSLL